MAVTTELVEFETPEINSPPGETRRRRSLAQKVQNQVSGSKVGGVDFHYVCSFARSASTHEEVELTVYVVAIFKNFIKY